MKTWIAGLLVAGLGLTNGATAAPLDYQEAVSGDLSGQTLFFDVGMNAVSGHATFSLSGVDLDRFAFVLPGNSVLTSATFTFQTTLAGPTTALKSHFTLFEIGTPLSLSSTEADLLDLSPVSLFESALPRAENGASFFIENGGSGDGQGGEWTYTLSFTVDAAAVPVPEPAALALLATGLLGFALRRRSI